ncbi:MAG: hypothetical protein AAB888_00830, partial [Patescibacteria group bacterium]
VNYRYEARSLGSGNWLVTKYQKADGTAVVSTTPLSKMIATSRDVTLASGTQDVTGFGFNPTSAMVMATIGITYAQASWGFAATDGTQWGLNQKGAGGVEYGSTGAIDFGIDNGTMQRGVISYITDGVRITWTKYGTPAANILQIGIIGFR